MLVDQDVKLALELCLLRSGGEGHTGRHGRHVLDDHETERVGGIVKQVGLHFDLMNRGLSAPFPFFSHQGLQSPHRNTHMLADGVEAELLQLLQVENQSLVVGRQVNPIRPETLVQRRPREDPLAIQQRPLHTIDDTTADGAEARVAGDGVVAQGDGQVVQGRRVGAPGIDAVNGEVERRAAGPAASAQDAAVLVQDRDLDGLARAVARGVHVDRGGPVGAGLDVELGDARRRGALEPHRLPDAAAGPVEDVLGVLGLLADWDDISVQVCWVEDKHLPVVTCHKDQRLDRRLNLEGSPPCATTEYWVRALTAHWSHWSSDTTSRRLCS